MNMFEELLFSEMHDQASIYDGPTVERIMDLIHGAPFIQDEDEFKSVQDYILSVYNSLVAKHPNQATVIGFGLAQKIIDAGSHRNYKRFDNPDVSLSKREDKAYRLLHKLLMIDRTIAQVSNDEGNSLLGIAANHRMDSIIELLLRYDACAKNREGEVALVAVMNGASPKLVAKLLTPKNTKTLTLDIERSSGAYIAMQLCNFIRETEQFKNLPSAVLTATPKIVARCIFAYAKALHPFYKELRKHYIWREEVIKLRFGKLEHKAEDSEQKQTANQPDFRVLMQPDLPRRIILGFCMPAYKKYQALADAAYAEKLAPTTGEVLRLRAAIAPTPEQVEQMRMTIASDQRAAAMDMNEINDLEPEEQAQIIALRELHASLRSTGIINLSAVLVSLASPQQINEADISNLAEEFFKHVVLPTNRLQF